MEDHINQDYDHDDDDISDQSIVEKITKDKVYGVLFGVLIEDLNFSISKNLLINCNLISKCQPIQSMKGTDQSNLPLLVLYTILNKEINFHLSAELREYQSVLEYFLNHDVYKQVQLDSSLSLITDVLNESESYEEGLINIPDEYLTLYSILAGAKYGLLGFNQEKLLQFNTSMIMKIFDKFWNYYKGN